MAPRKTSNRTRSVKPAARPKRGRPIGPTAPTDAITLPSSRCARCGSSHRAPYCNVVTRAIHGTDGQGRPYTHVTWRYTRCLDCQQRRCERTFDYRPDAHAPMLDAA